MRRCAQFQIECSRGDMLTQPSVDAAIEEMPFAGGALNRRLLGGEGAEESANQAICKLSAISGVCWPPRCFKADS